MTGVRSNGTAHRCLNKAITIVYEKSYCGIHKHQAKKYAV